MAANHPQWAVQYPVSGELPDKGPWRCYLFARLEAKAEKGSGMHLGLYDSAGRKSVAGCAVSIEESAGKEYRKFDLGVHELGPAIYFWAAPCNNPDQVEAVYVDRIVLVREQPLATP